MNELDRSPRWYSGITATQWMVLAIASAGWIFDVYEGQLFTIYKTPMLRGAGRRAEQLGQPAR